MIKPSYLIFKFITLAYLFGFSARISKAKPLPFCFPEILADYSFSLWPEDEIFSGHPAKGAKAFSLPMEKRNDPKPGIVNPPETGYCLGQEKGVLCCKMPVLISICDTAAGSRKGAPYRYNPNRLPVKRSRGVEAGPISRQAGQEKNYEV